MQTPWDNQFKNIKDLKWLPWIGELYFDIPKEKRMLIVGESHYHDGMPASILKHDNPFFTREVVDEMAIDRYYWNTKIFPNLHLALFGNDTFDTGKFWERVSFYNFIQRPMHTNKERPGYSDFHDAWMVFHELLEKLEPAICLFIGTSSANILGDTIDEYSRKCDKVHWEDFISNAYAKSAVLTREDGETTDLVFIKHTSSMFSWPRWNEYLQRKIGNQLNWFQEQIK